MVSSGIRVGFLYLILTTLLLIQMEDNNAISFSKYNGIGQVKCRSQGERITPSLQDSSGSILPNQVQYDPSSGSLWKLRVKFQTMYWDQNDQGLRTK